MNIWISKSCFSHLTGATSHKLLVTFKAELDVLFMVSFKKFHVIKSTARTPFLSTHYLNFRLKWRKIEFFWQCMFLLALKLMSMEANELPLKSNYFLMAFLWKRNPLEPSDPAKRFKIMSNHQSTWSWLLMKKNVLESIGYWFLGIKDSGSKYKIINRIIQNRGNF